MQNSKRQVDKVDNVEPAYGLNLFYFFYFPNTEPSSPKTLVEIPDLGSCSASGHDDDAGHQAGAYGVARAGELESVLSSRCSQTWKIS